MTDEDDYRRVEERGAKLYARWQNEHPDASREIEELKEQDTTNEDLDAWRTKYPEAVAGWGLLAFYSRDVVRKMRMTEPGWEPPPEWDSLPL